MSFPSDHDYLDKVTGIMLNNCLSEKHDIYLEFISMSPMSKTNGDAFPFVELNITPFEKEKVSFPEASVHVRQNTVGYKPTEDIL